MTSEIEQFCNIIKDAVENQQARLIEYDIALSKLSEKKKTHIEIQSQLKDLKQAQSKLDDADKSAVTKVK